MLSAAGLCGENKISTNTVGPQKGLPERAPVFTSGLLINAMKDVFVMATV